MKHTGLITKAIALLLAALAMSAFLSVSAFAVTSYNTKTYQTACTTVTVNGSVFSAIKGYIRIQNYDSNFYQTKHNYRLVYSNGNSLYGTMGSRSTASIPLPLNGTYKLYVYGSNTGAVYVYGSGVSIR